MNAESQAMHEEHRRGSPPWSLMRASVLQWPWHAFGVPYGTVVWARNVLYDRGWFAQRRLPCRVVSVGNLTVGGTGKTPVVMWVVEQLLDRGFRVGVLSRGYRRRSHARRLLVSDGRTVLAGPEDAGDEPYLIARRCERAVVAVGADRYRLGQWVLDQFSLDYIVLDDGFQYRVLHRDVDLLLLDASTPNDLRAVLPAGRLREPLSAAGRATALLFTRADLAVDVACLRALLGAAAPGHATPVLVRFVATAYVDVGTGAIRDLADAAGRAVVLFSGIGNTDSFRSLVERLGVKIAQAVAFPDHHGYTVADLDGLRERVRRCRADLLLTTEKDAVKIHSLVHPDDPVWALRLTTDIMEGREQLEQVILGKG